MRKKILGVSALVVILYFPFFSHLSMQPLRLWDEARNAFSAYEMSQSGNLLVTSYRDIPDMWNLKPPFLIWCQALLMKVFGPEELAIRLPSALAGFLTALMIFIFSWKYFNRFWLGFIAAIVLVTSRDYMEFHGTRTGDFDSMLTLFTVFYCLCFFLFFDTGKWKYYNLAIAGLILATLTKGIAGTFFLPAIIVSAFFFRKVKIILSNRNFYLSILFFLLFSGGYYFLREHFNPGYIKAVISNEWGGRFNEVIEGHKGPFWVYFEKTHTWYLAYWALLIPCGALAGYLDNENRFKKFTVYITGVLVLFWLILSISETKITWYFYPALPLLSILAATMLYYIFVQLERIEIQGALKYKILPYVFIFIVAYKPYREIIKVTYLPKEKEFDVPFYSMGYYMRDLIDGKIYLNEPINIVFNGIADHIDFYVRLANKNGKTVRIKPMDQLQNADLVLCSQDEVDNYLKANYTMDEINHSDHLYLYHITGRKSQ